MKTLLLLGGFGFIGTNILGYIDDNDLDYNVIVFDKFPSHQEGFSFNCVKKVYSGDFEDNSLLSTIFKENRIDIVIHSISASVPSALNDNIFDIQHNIIPTIQLLNIMLSNKVENIIFISSGGAIYGDNIVNEGGHIENEDAYPKSAYGISKLVIEKYLHMYHQLFGINSIVLRLSNPYGPFHYSTKQGIINIAIDKILNKECISIWGNGNGKKDYIYIEDFCDILFSLIQNQIIGFQLFNVGCGEDYSINEILEKLTNISDCLIQTEYVSSNKNDVQNFKLNINKLLSVIPQIKFTDIDTGLRKTLEWSKKHNNAF